MSAKVCIYIICFFLSAAPVFAVERSPQWWTMEAKVGFWMPTDKATKQFFDKCCNVVPMINGGFLYQGRYGAEIGAGMMVQSGTAVGSVGGAQSQDSFNLFLVPMETNAVMRFDFAENQIVVPYIKGGGDYVFFRENVEGNVTKGLKSGLHTIGGLQFLIEAIDTDASLETDYGINDFYIVVETRYGWVNSFGRNGLDLSGLTYSAGLLFEF